MKKKIALIMTLALTMGLTVTGCGSKTENAQPTGGKTVYVCVEGELIAENKNRLESGAHIVISDHPITRNVDDNK